MKSVMLAPRVSSAVSCANERLHAYTIPGSSARVLLLGTEISNFGYALLNVSPECQHEQEENTMSVDVVLIRHGLERAFELTVSDAEKQETAGGVIVSSLFCKKVALPFGLPVVVAQGVKVR
jgi:hypothetical protein